ncbi:MAG: UMP kinase [Deltaproteobacteria bacterium]|nr:UMP kinase [Deltaproteobacteria bacterium]MBW2082292.1 UMP kinase [Deltaproteobacteria bacterium]HDM08914.1 UMP kinase [Desulfobacteraceae bacterium]
MNSERTRFKRILLKLSGEALSAKSDAIDPQTILRVAREIKSAHDLGVQIAIVIGGGNIFRGLRAVDYRMDRVVADHMGMLATVINALALGGALQTVGLEAQVMSAIEMRGVAEPFVRDAAINYLEDNRVVIFGGGTGNPYFTTDTAATLRASEIGANALLKATKVDGVYDADPVKVPGAKRFDTLSYGEVIEKGLRAMDLTAISLAMEQKIPIVVFNLLKGGNILKAVAGERVGTIIRGE